MKKIMDWFTMERLEIITLISLAVLFISIMHLFFKNMAVFLNSGLLSFCTLNLYWNFWF